MAIATQELTVDPQSLQPEAFGAGALAGSGALAALFGLWKMAVQFLDVTGSRRRALAEADAARAKEAQAFAEAERAGVGSLAEIVKAQIARVDQQDAEIQHLRDRLTLTEKRARSQGQLLGRARKRLAEVEEHYRRFRVAVFEFIGEITATTEEMPPPLRVRVDAAVGRLREHRAWKD
jgi:hypothetical protein